MWPWCSSAVRNVFSHPMVEVLWCCPLPDDRQAKMVHGEVAGSCILQ